MVGGPHDGAALKVPDHVTSVTIDGWPGIYQRKSLSANVEVLDHAMPVEPSDRWVPRRRTAHFGVDRKPFTR